MKLLAYAPEFKSHSEGGIRGCDGVDYFLDMS